MESSVADLEFELGKSLPRGRHNLDREVVLASQRGRLITAFVTLAAERGYDKVTIIDIVSLAGTSKRTFYEHFSDKEDCMLQAFDTTRDLLFSSIAAAVGPVQDPVERIRVGMQVYIKLLGDLPEFTRAFLSEAMAAGSALAERWIDATDIIAAMLSAWREESREAHPEMPELPPARAKIVVLGINEMVCMLVHREGIDGLIAAADELVDHAVALLTAE